MYTPKEAIENTIIDLLSWDAPITTQNIINQLQFYIDNLNSYIGIESHKRLESLGIKDETGMSWTEQDAQTIEQINDYKSAINEVELLPPDYNWKPLETEMLNWMLTH